MKTSDLHREWARVLDMCEGTEVSPNICVKYIGDASDRVVNLGGHPNDYEFAIAILEGKPVFVGDKVWLCNAERYTDATKFHGEVIKLSECSWHEPKRKTIMLNGVELPAPVANSEGIRLDFLGVDHFFETVEDRNKVAAAIENLLEGK